MTAAMIAIGYFSSCLVFSGAYWAAWAYNPDCFIVHQEMNVRPAAAWRAAVRNRGRPVSSAPVPSGRTLDEQFDQYSSLASAEAELQQQIEQLKPRLDYLNLEVPRLGALHNHATSRRMKDILVNDTLAYRSTLDKILSDLRQKLTDNPADLDQAAAMAKEALRNAPAKALEHEAVIAQATQTEYLERLSALYDEQTQTSGKMLNLTERLHKNRVAQRELMEGWEDSDARACSISTFSTSALASAHRIHSAI